MSPKVREFFIVGLIFLIGFVHYSCQLYLVQHTQLHNVVLKLFYLPIVLSAYWWGLRGGALVGIVCSIIYGVDIFRWWDPEGSQNYNHIAEMIVFLAVGAVLGWRVDSDRKAREEKKKAEERAEAEFRRAITDPLTKAYNRHFMDPILEEFWEKAQAGEEPFSLLMVDLNKFKFINDNYGHLAGDRVLQATVQTIFGQVRKTDYVFRFGGDEFLVLLPETPQDRALELARKLREEMGKLTFHSQDHSPFKADFSVGVLDYRPDLKGIKEAINKLDESLYRAKNELDRVALAS
jgi:diguanylate cyclase (GGDEF)-like protein